MCNCTNIKWGKGQQLIAKIRKSLANPYLLVAITCHTVPLRNAETGETALRDVSKCITFSIGKGQQVFDLRDPLCLLVASSCYTPQGKIFDVLHMGPAS
mmetsp:Transcript_13241/g.24288  ORF Transcript_13241/g.24288 Transcript_13241/m.24288 type:complete len:99 (+) Transcript_13241:440-736(+)